MHIEPPAVYLRDTRTAKGRAVYAASAFAAGDLVESCPVVVFEGSFGNIPDEVRKVLFNWGVLAGAATAHCLALGYGSLYNHDNPANMRYEADPAGHALRFIAVRAIAEGEELTVNYNARGGGHRSDDDTWFERMGVVPIVSAK